VSVRLTAAFCGINVCFPGVCFRGGLTRFAAYRSCEEEWKERVADVVGCRDGCHEAAKGVGLTRGGPFRQFPKRLAALSIFFIIFYQVWSALTSQKSVYTVDKALNTDGKVVYSLMVEGSKEEHEALTEVANKSYHHSQSILLTVRIQDFEEHKYSLMQSSTLSYLAIEKMMWIARHHSMLFLFLDTSVPP
jgi:hypothetical protein